MKFCHFLAAALLVGTLVGLVAWRFPPEKAHANLLNSPFLPPGPCSQSTTFIARTSGMDSTHQTAFTTMICGLVADGVINGTMSGSATSGGTACGSLIDILYIYATNSSANALLNLCSTAFAGTTLSSPTFTVDTGFGSAGAAMVTSGGVGTVGYLPSSAGGNFTLNAGSIGDWSFTSTMFTNTTIGSADFTGVHETRIVNQYTDGNMYCDINDDATPLQYQVAVGGGNGFFACVRTSSNHVNGYLNGALLTAAAGTDAAVSTGLNSTQSLFMNGYQAATGDVASNRQVAMSFVGGNLSTANVLAIYTRVCAYLTTIHGSC